MIFTPSEIFISTMTVTCKTSHTLDYEYTYKNIKATKSIRAIRYKDNNGNIKILGKSKNSKPPKRLFCNQITLEILIPNTKKLITCKVFKNGAIHMVGCRSRNDAVCVSKIIVSEIKSIGGYVYTLPTLINKFKPSNLAHLINNYFSPTIKIYDFKIRLINSNFNMGVGNKSIDRYELYRLLSQNHNYLVKFEPDTYPGVKLYLPLYQNNKCYNWKIRDVAKWLIKIGCKECIPKFHNKKIDGDKLLYIDHHNLKKMGIDNSDIREKIVNSLNSKTFIKKVTIITFRTGQILITGANQFIQLEKSYKFISNFINRFANQVVVK